MVNAYAVGNWGDAAIVEGLVASLRQAGFETIAVAPVDWRNDAPWRRLGADEVVQPLISLIDAPEWIRRSKPLVLGYASARMGRSVMPARLAGGAAHAYRDADLVVSAGGAYLGGSKPGVNFVKLGNIRAGVLAGRPTALAPVTINPSSHPVRLLLHRGLQGVCAFVRDAPSQDQLDAIGVHGRLVPDLALRAPSLARASRLTATSSVSSATIGWAPRSYRPDHSAWGQSEAAEATLVAAVRRILAKTNVSVRLIAHVRARSDDDDYPAVLRIAAELRDEYAERVVISPDPTNLDEAVARYADLDVLLTSRMHAAIFAMAVGTPALAIGYEPKVAGVMSDLGLPERVLPASDRLAVRDVADLIRTLWRPPERERTRNAFHNAQLRFEPFDEYLAGIASSAPAAQTHSVSSQ